MESGVGEQRNGKPVTSVRSFTAFSDQSRSNVPITIALPVFRNHSMPQPGQPNKLADLPARTGKHVTQPACQPMRKVRRLASRLMGKLAIPRMIRLALHSLR